MERLTEMDEGDSRYELKKAWRDGTRFVQMAIVGQTSQGPEAQPGIVTVIGRPSLLGPLGLMSWLGGFYERARGGKFGLIVLALPGVIREGRVRLNNEYSLPYTPDMAAMCLVEDSATAS